MYKITDYSYKQANKLGVSIKPSTNKKKKIDVFKQDKKIASIGAAGMGDFPTYLKEKGPNFANERRRLFNARFKESSKIKDSPAYFAKKILW
jgi:hypothetical protein